MVTESNIIDIRGNSFDSNTNSNLKSKILNSLKTKRVRFEDSLIRSIPTMVLYDDKGLQIFDKITYSADYYLTNCEIEILSDHSAEFVLNNFDSKTCLIELGCGSMRKTCFILDSIVKARKNVIYYAIDLSENSLRDGLDKLTRLLGTYDDSLIWIHNNIESSMKKIYLWIGSSIGNFNRDDASKFLRHISENAMNSNDLMVCGIDKRNSPDKITLAYNDSKGVTRDFILNGLQHINRIFNHDFINVDNFDYLGVYNSDLGRHEAYYKSKIPQILVDNDSNTHISIEKDELINVEYSYKYSEEEISALLMESKLMVNQKWTDKHNLYNFYLLSKEINSFV